MLVTHYPKQKQPEFSILETANWDRTCPCFPHCHWLLSTILDLSCSHGDIESRPLLSVLALTTTTTLRTSPLASLPLAAFSPGLLLWLVGRAHGVKDHKPRDNVHPLHERRERRENGRSASVCIGARVLQLQIRAAWVRL